MKFKKIGLALMAAALGSSFNPAQAQTARYPERPVHIVVGFPPGGVPDTLARLLAEHFSHCPVIHERTLFSNLYGRGRTVFTAQGIPYLDRAQAEILAVRHALDRMMEEVAV